MEHALQPHESKIDEAGDEYCAARIDMGGDEQFTTKMDKTGDETLTAKNDKRGDKIVRRQSARVQRARMRKAMTSTPQKHRPASRYSSHPSPTGVMHIHPGRKGGRMKAP